jgi:hypothetical protein
MATGGVPNPGAARGVRAASNAGLPREGDPARSARLGEQGSRRRNRDVTGPIHRTERADLGPRLFAAQGDELFGPLKYQDHPLASRRWDSGGMLAGGLPGLAHGPAQGAWPARVERVLHRGRNRLGPCVAGKHPCPGEHLGDIQHRAAGTEPGAEKRDRGKAAGHSLEDRIRNHSRQANLEINLPG